MDFMKFTKLSVLSGKIITYLLTTVIASALTLGIFGNLPAQAALYSQIPAAKLAVQIPNSGNGDSFVAAAVNRVGSAVVRIDTERTITRRVDPFFDDPRLRHFFGDQFIPQMPQQERLRGQGSGFIIDRSGIILTNAHVVDQADKVTVTLKDGRTLEGKVQGVDEVTDLAVVKVQGGNDLPVTPLGDSNVVQVGDWAIAVGNPFGLDNTVTLGIVSTLKRSSAAVGIPGKRLEFIQTDAAINPGNSGGPLLNSKGEVIGINTAIRPDAMGIGFAIPINKAKEISTQLAQGIKVQHPYLGIQMTTLTPQLAAENNSDPNSPLQVPEINGVLVVRVLPNTPAAQAGLRRGDVILQINEEPVTTAEQLQDVVENNPMGSLLQIKVRRGNQTSSLAIRTGELQNAA